MAGSQGFAVTIAALREAGDVALFGEKAAGLAAIAAAGLPVPGAFCVGADAYRAHMEHAGVGDLVGLLHGIGEDEPPVAITSQLQRIRSAIVRTPLDPVLVTALDRAFDELGEGAVSVRSSLTRDDRPAGSFAPQHGTYFAPDRPAAVRNIQHCWATLWTDWAWRRRPHTEREVTEPAVATVIQRLIAADASGVVFTADPATGDPDTLVVESCFGLGEALVAAKVDPDRYRLSRNGLELLDQQLGDKSRELVIRDDGSIAELVVDPARAWQPSLHLPSLSLVADLALRVADVLGAPAAVEFAVADGHAWILQGRPIVFGG